MPTSSRMALRILRRYAIQHNLPLGNEDLQDLDSENDDFEDFDFEDDGFDDDFDGDDRVYWGREGAGILFRTATRVLLLHRSSRVNEPGTWGVVGGRVEEGEDLKVAAHREALEELGRVPSYHIVDKFVFKDEGFQYTTFIAQVDESVPENWKPRLNWENVDWAWVPRGRTRKYRLHFGVKPVLTRIGWI